MHEQNENYLHVHLIYVYQYFILYMYVNTLNDIKINPNLFKLYLVRKKNQKS